jgi:hypothetical protein
MLVPIQSRVITVDDSIVGAIVGTIVGACERIGTYDSVGSAVILYNNNLSANNL